MASIESSYFFICSFILDIQENVTLSFMSSKYNVKYKVLVFSCICLNKGGRVFPVFLPLFFFRIFLIHSRMLERSRVFVHGHTFLHSWSKPMTLVVCLLHGATFLSNLPLVLFVSFIGPQ